MQSVAWIGTDIVSPGGPTDHLPMAFDDRSCGPVAVARVGRAAHHTALVRLALPTTKNKRMPEEWLHDVFVSYGHADGPWADRVRDSLRAADPTRRIFFDNHSLRAGDDWESRIQNALEGSRHFLLLWSDRARASDWVQRELFYFMASAKPRTDPRRRLVCLNLQGANAATRVFQHIDDAGLQSEYLLPIVAGAAPSPAWRQAMQAVERGFDAERRLLEVALVVLTFARDDVDRLEADALAAIDADFGLSGAALAARYGATRRDWKPFGGDATVETLLHETRRQLDGAMPGRAVQWRMPPDAFWTGGMQGAQDFVDHAFKPAELSVLVVDPVALHRKSVYQRLMLFQDRLDNGRTTILTLPPFDTPPRVQSLRTALMTHAMPYFDHYFKSTPPPRRHVAAQCGWNVSDADEMRRLILAAADTRDPPATRSDQGLVFLQQRARP